jgi:hypothetical protein
VSTFDIEPEDAWDPGDDVALLVDNLQRRLVLLHAPRRARRARTLSTQLDDIVRRLDRVRRRRNLTERELLRIADTFEDVRTIRELLR